jgi:hypothetical protein
MDEDRHDECYSKKQLDEAVEDERERCARLVEKAFATIHHDRLTGNKIPVGWETEDVDNAREKFLKEIRNGW